MAGANNYLGIGDLLIAMKETAMQHATDMTAFSDIRLSGGSYRTPFTSPTLYLIPLGSSEEELGENGVTIVKRATHRIAADIIKHDWAQDEATFTRNLVGSSSERGLTQLGEDVLTFYEHNWLGLGGAGLDAQIAPTAEIPDGGYDQVFIEEKSDKVFISRARVIVTYATEPFTRAITTP